MTPTRSWEVSLENPLRRVDADQIGICSRFLLYEMMGTVVPFVKHKLAFYTSWWSSNAGISADSQILLCFDLSNSMTEAFCEGFKGCNPRAIPGSIIASAVETVTTRYDTSLRPIFAETERGLASWEAPTASSIDSILRHAFATLAVASKTTSSLMEAVRQDE